jgi:hypothetical protein
MLDELDGCPHHVPRRVDVEAVATFGEKHGTQQNCCQDYQIILKVLEHGLNLICYKNINNNYI